MKKKNGRNEDGCRVYRCKRCCREIRENLHWWKRKKQSEKNICPDCILRIHRPKAYEPQSRYVKHHLHIGV